MTKLNGNGKINLDSYWNIQVSSDEECGRTFKDEVFDYEWTCTVEEGHDGPCVAHGWDPRIAPETRFMIQLGILSREDFKEEFGHYPIIPLVAWTDGGDEVVRFEDEDQLVSIGSFERVEESEEPADDLPF